MFTVLLKRSPRTGNPEIWAFEERSSDCSLVFGSLLTGGLQNQSKAKGYGSSKLTSKIRDGYSLATSCQDFKEIESVKTAIRGGAIPSGTSAAYAIYCEAMRIWKKTPTAAASFLPPAKASAPAKAATSLPTPSPKRSSISETPVFVRKNENNGSWAW